MKKLLLKSLACLSLIVLIGSCSSDNETPVDMNAAADTYETANRGGHWDGVLAIDKGNNEFEFVVDTAPLLADLEAVLATEGTPTDLKDIRVVSKVAANNPGHNGIFVIATDQAGTSVAVAMIRNGSNVLMDPSAGGGKTTTCRGCTNGCNLEYYLIDGRKVPYCNENGCTYDCSKTESTF